MRGNSRICRTKDARLRSIHPYIAMNEAFVAIRNVAETNTENTTTAKSLKLVLVEKMEKLNGQGAHSA